MVKFGAHAFVWIGDWTVEDGNHAIEEAASSGFDFLEIPMLRPERFDARAHREALEKAGISSTVSLVLPKDKHMPAQPEAARDWLIGVMDQMDALGCTYLTGCICYALGALTGRPPTEAERQTVIDVMKDLAGEAKKRGITLGIEPINRYEGYIYNVLEDGAAAIEAIGADNVILHADTYHMNIEEEGFYNPLVLNAKHLDYIHMSESHRGLVGTGTVIWDDIWKALAHIKFGGHLVLESFTAINPDLAAGTCLWRPTSHPPSTLATKGLAFLKEGAARAGLNGEGS